MQVKDVMTTSVITASSDDTIERVAKMMREHDVGFVPVIESEQVMGLVTDRDLVTRGIAGGVDVTRAVREIATPKVWTVYEHDDVETLRDVMNQKRVRRMVVLSGEDRPVGVVTLGDLAHEGDPEAAMAVLETVSDPAAPKRIDRRTEARPSFATGVR